MTAGTSSKKKQSRPKGGTKKEENAASARIWERRKKKEGEKGKSDFIVCNPQGRNKKWWLGPRRRKHHSFSRLWRKKKGEGKERGKKRGRPVGLTINSRLKGISDPSITR